jgi:DNA-binding NarL/FixJ family response regulator
MQGSRLSENGIPAFEGPVVVLDDCPAYSRGLSAALGEAGFSVQKPENLLRWASKKGVRVAVVSLAEKSREKGMRDLGSAGSDIQLVALLSETTASTYCDALRLGACGAVGHDDPLSEIVGTVGAATQGRTLLPKGIALEVAGTYGPPSPVDLNSQEMHWIRALAAGATVSELADEVGYSERELYRLLKRLYARLGVERRSEALVRAGTLGLVN